MVKLMQSGRTRKITATSVYQPITHLKVVATPKQPLPDALPIPKPTTASSKSTAQNALRATLLTPESAICQS